jgi:hypothetical protein
MKVANACSNEFLYKDFDGNVKGGHIKRSLEVWKSFLVSISDHVYY